MESFRWSSSRRSTAPSGGDHDFRIERGGIRVFARLIAAEHHQPFRSEIVPSGLAELDALLGGGLDRGTSALFIGPAGTGKSVLAAQYASAAAIRGDAASIYVFDESGHTLTARAQALGMRMEEMIASARLRIQQIDPAQMSPGEMVDRIRQEVE